MSELRKLLELLHGPSTPWLTARLVVRRWGDSAVARVALGRAGQQLRSQGVTTVVTARESAGREVTWEMLTRAWVDRVGDRTRTEISSAHGESLVIRTGSRWWSHSPHSGSISNETEPEAGGGGIGDLDWLLNPSALLPAYDFTPVGRSQIAGRDTVQARAVPRTPDPRVGPGAGVAHGADEVLLAVDEERGVVMRSEARLDGRPFSVVEVEELFFDETFTDELFRFVSPDGSPVRAPHEIYARPEPVSLKEAAKRAAFTVLVPTRLPQGWTIDASYRAASSRPLRPESVTVTVHVTSGVLMERRLRIHETAEPLRYSDQWDEVTHGGRSIRLLQHPAPDGAHEATVQVEGTHARVTGNLDRDAFVGIVASLEPVQGSPPL